MAMAAWIPLMLRMDASDVEEAQPHVTTGQLQAGRRHSSLVTILTIEPCLMGLGKE
jgi:hypothetical protein